jgi:hypothetical protein
VAKGTRNRVVGVLLGAVQKDKVDITNSYAGAFAGCACAQRSRPQCRSRKT